MREVDFQLPGIILQIAEISYRVGGVRQFCRFQSGGEASDWIPLRAVRLIEAIPRLLRVEFFRICALTVLPSLRALMFRDVEILIAFGVAAVGSLRTCRRVAAARAILHVGGEFLTARVRFPLFRRAGAQPLARQPRQEHSGLPAAGYAALGSGGVVSALTFMGFFHGIA